MRGFLPYFEAHYGRAAALGYASRDSRDRIIVWGETELQQGDPPASALFSPASQPIAAMPGGAGPQTSRAKSR
eukprot:1277408-Rhodomonas_salina.1